MLAWRELIEYYHDAMDNRGDPRVKNWFMMSGPLPTFIICISYAYFVKVIGPKLMENRQAFVLRRLMIYYNLLQVLMSIYLFHGCLKYGWWNDYSFGCQPVDYSYEPRALGMANGCWWYYISKFTEFFDTFFFVLRKKNKHISNLHVYHHAIMPFSVWWGVKYYSGGHYSFFGLLNTFVHIIMYGYYLLAALGPKMQPYLWWKKYLTTLQILQFILVMIHTVQFFFIDCDYPISLALWGFAQALMFFYMFRNFYVESYTKKENKKLASLSSTNSKQQ